MNLKCTENCALMHRFLCKLESKIRQIDEIAKKVFIIRDFHPTYSAFFRKYFFSAAGYFCFFNEA
jgi:ABC-type Zn2+ transport system substrate-binding protein/surface adhesin